MDTNRSAALTGGAAPLFAVAAACIVVVVLATYVAMLVGPEEVDSQVRSLQTLQQCTHSFTEHE